MGYGGDLDPNQIFLTWFDGNDLEAMIVEKLQSRLWKELEDERSLTGCGDLEVPAKKRLGQWNDFSLRCLNGSWLGFGLFRPLMERGALML